MASVQHKRKEAALFRAASEILAEEITNANVSYTTVTSVEYSNDGSHLTLFLSFESNSEKSLFALEAAKGFIKRRLAKTVSLRKVPEIHLKLDTSADHGRKIDEILKEINNK